jgi:hypothetical protein
MPKGVRPVHRPRIRDPVRSAKDRWIRILFRANISAKTANIFISAGIAATSLRQSIKNKGIRRE